MKIIQPKPAKFFAAAFAALLLLAGCGSSSGLLADGGIIGTGSIIGTVPGTVIEAYGDNGEYFETFSENNNTDNHPFRLQVEAGLGLYLVMTINQGTPDEIVMPIAFPGNKAGEVFARIVLREGQEIDLGHIALYKNCSDVPVAIDPDLDCVLDSPFILDEDQGARNPLREMDVDEDGIDDYDDEDHGYGQQNGQQYYDPQDLDNDQVPNFYDDDYNPGPDDTDADGIEDSEDKNPGNMPGENSEDEHPSGWDGQSMHPLVNAWLEQHGEYAEDNLNSCASCHGTDFQGTPASHGVGCYDCHTGPIPEDD